MSIPIPTLRSERLTLRGWCTSDTDALHRVMQDGDALRYFPTTQPPSRERVRAIISGQLDHWRLHGFGWWALEDRASGAFVGWCGLQYLSDTGEVEVAYLLDRDFWGQGLATEAATAAVAYGFDHVGLDTIVALAHPENVASQRVIEKLGMAFLEETVYFGMRVRRYSMARPAPTGARDGVHRQSTTGGPGT